jgi:eukaryotic-like serine/threonine-protein kinase
LLSQETFTEIVKTTNITITSMDCKAKTLTVIIAILCILSVFPILLNQAQAESATGNWPMFRQDPAHTAYSSISGPSTPKVLWTFSDGDNSLQGSPAIVDGKLYIGSANGNIYCLNATNGNEIWLNFKINAEIQSSPAIANGYLYIIGRDGVIYCLNAETGDLVWKYKTGYGTGSSPTVVNGYVYATSQDGNLYCLNGLNGQQIWRFSLISLAGPSSPYDEQSITSGGTSPAVVDGYVYVGGTNFYRLDAVSGALSWSFPVNVATSPTVYEGRVYFSARDKNAYCLDASTGQEVWEKPIITTELYTGASPTVANGLVYFGSWVQCVNASSGERVWRYGTGDIYSSVGPTVAGQYAYFYGSDNNLYCVKAATGEYVWKTNSPGGSPVVLNGVLYIAGGSLVVYGDAGNTTPPLPSSTEYNRQSPNSTISKDTIISTQILIIFSIAGILATILIYITKRKGSPTQATLKKGLKLPIALILIFLIATSSAIALYESSQNTPNSKPSSNSPAGLLWQTVIEHSATSMTTGDGKVFIATRQGTYAYNDLDGQLLWKNEGAAGIGTQWYNGSVYVGVFGSVVYRLDENTGEKILTYQAPAASNIAWKGTPDFVVADGKVFAVSGDGIAVFDAKSGGPYWTIGGLFNYPFYPYPQPTLGELSSSANPSNYIYILYGGRVDANNGNMLWNTGNHVASNYIIIDNKVIFWNFWVNQANPDNILCVDASSGKTLWQFNSGIPIYQPTVYGGFLLLPRTDGNIYALRLLDGSLAWTAQGDSKAMMEGNNLPANAKSFSDPSVSRIVVDPQTNIATWGFLITQHQINGTNGNDLYIGDFSSIMLSNGTILRKTSIQANGSISNGASLGLALGEKDLYLTAGTDLWTIDKSSGNSTLIQHYESSAGPIASNNNRVYVAADLYLSAYG